MNQQFYVYILLCKDNTLYTGFAGDLEKRLIKHNLGVGAKYTRGRTPVKLVYSEQLPSKSEALIRELQIKKLTREEKLVLINKGWAKDKPDELKNLIPDKGVTSAPGTLYLCATPLGNLEDITLRALRTLKECDLVAAEDTRRTIKLLNHYEISTPLTSYHEHNEKTKGLKLIEELSTGKNIALVSDAGLPGISDPGNVIVKLALDQGIKVVPIPGPSAGVTALVSSGLSTERFVFEGFLPRGKKRRREIVEALVGEVRTIILYESPHRLKNTLKELSESLGHRRMVLARELTKIHEEFIRGTVSEIAYRYKEVVPRGEYCLIIEGEEIKGRRPQNKEAQSCPLDAEGENGVFEMVRKLHDRGMSKRDAIKEVASILGVSKREIYNKIMRK